MPAAGSTLRTISPPLLASATTRSAPQPRAASATARAQRSGVGFRTEASASTRATPSSPSAQITIPQASPSAEAGGSTPITTRRAGALARSSRQLSISARLHRAPSISSISSPSSFLTPEQRAAELGLHPAHEAQRNMPGVVGSAAARHPGLAVRVVEQPPQQRHRARRGGRHDALLLAQPQAQQQVVPGAH